MPFPVPDGVTVHHELSETTVQLAFEVTVKATEPEGEAGTLWFDGATLRVGKAASWVTVTVEVGAPEAVTVMVATLFTNSVFTV